MTKQAEYGVNRIEATGDPHKWCERAVSVLRAGGIVAFPTETVYGLAACVTAPGAIDKLNALKSRPPDKPYTVHIAKPAQLGDYVSTAPWPARVLARKGWPGPITMVLTMNDQCLADARQRFASDCKNLFSENTIGLRCPDHPVAYALLADCSFPVVAPSANPSGEPPAYDADAVCRYFPEGGVDLVLDAGPTRYRQSSTVVSIADRDVKVLREGPISAETVGRLIQFNILFVCTGNTCRSPMAEALCRGVFADMIGCREAELADFNVTIGSAGTFASDGAPASREAVVVMDESSIDIGQHASRALTADLAGQADVIYVMTSEHRDAVCSLAPQAADRVQLVGGHESIDDPIGSGQNAYLRCAGKLRDAIGYRLTELFQ